MSIKSRKYLLILFVLTEAGLLLSGIPGLAMLAFLALLLLGFVYGKPVADNSIDLSPSLKNYLDVRLNPIHDPNKPSNLD